MSKLGRQIASAALAGVLALAMGGCKLTDQVTTTARGVLVLGANGKLGAETARALVQRGYEVTAFVRPTSDLKRLEALDISYFVGDLTHDDDVRRAFETHAFHTVIDCSARRGTTEPFYDLSMQSIVRWGKRNGLRQVIYHSSVGVGESMKIAEVAQAFGTLQGEKRRIYQSTMSEKLAAEIALKNSGLKYTIIRNWLLMPEGTPPTGKARLTEDLNRLGRVTRTDLARIGAGCVGEPACFNKSFNALDDSITPQ